MDKIKRLYRSLLESVKNNQAKSSQKAMLEELFNDFYMRRKQVYKMNFVRGIFFGLGTAIGGTIVLAILIWILSLFVDLPLIGDLLKEAENSLKNR